MKIPYFFLVKITRFFKSDGNTGKVKLCIVKKVYVLLKMHQLFDMHINACFFYVGQIILLEYNIIYAEILSIL